MRGTTKPAPRRRQRLGARSAAAFVAASCAAVLGIASGVAVQPAAAQMQRSTRTTDITNSAAQTPPSTTPSTTTPLPTIPSPEDFEASMRARFASPDLFDADVDPATYVLGPSDVLAVMLLIGETRTHTLPVLPEGVVMVPGIGPVPASGKTLADFRKSLQAAVAKRYRNFELYCYLARQRQFRVYVTGEVRDPGLMAARASERVSDLVDRAGGFTDRASRREIEIRDADGKVGARADLGRFLARGDLGDNPHVAAGYVVHVPPRGNQVMIAGEVRAPGYYELRDGETLPELLELAGGPTAVANLSSVTVERTNAAGTVAVETYDLNHDAPSTENITRVSVLSSMLGKRRVYFISPDERQQPLFLSPDETLGDLVRRTATLPPDADLAAARLATRDSIGHPFQVAVDLTKVLSGEQDRVLRDGDVLSVPGVKDYVYVSGFVTRPGRYTYRPEWTVNDYIGEAGGPASGGSRDRVTLLGREGSRRDADRRTSVQRGETVYIDRSLGSKFTGGLGILVNLSALAISLVALSR
jgi:protein involved in polysaccharide export with SLBB domain